jgi:transposase
MGTYRTTITKVTSSSRQSRASLAGFQSHNEWNPLDIKNRCALERLTSSVSTIPNLPSSFPVFSQAGRFRQDSPKLSSRFKGARGFGFTGMFYRRQLRRSQKRGLFVGNTKRGKGTKIMAITDRSGLPVSVHIESASPHEAGLVEETISQRFVKSRLQVLIGDKAYDSDKLDKKLAKKRIVLIAPHKNNRVKPKTQDGRPLRKIKKRWKVERLFAWLYNYRRIVNRWEYHVLNFVSFVKLATILILIRNYL